MKLVSIGQLEKSGAIIKIQDGNHGAKHPKSSDYVVNGIPFIMASDISDNRLDMTACKKIPKKLSDTLRIGFATTGDVLLSHKGTVGQVAIVPEIDGHVMLTPQVTFYRIDKNFLSNRYLAYAFESPVFQAQLESFSFQSTRPYIGITSQRFLKVPYFPINVQNKIVDVLSSYDDLIENNLQRIKLLEKLAQITYEEWFVHFKFPGHEKLKITSDTKLPEGWARKSISSICNINQSSIKSKKPPEKIHYIDIASVETGYYSNPIELDFSQAPSRARRIVEYGDTIFSMVRPNRKIYSLILEDDPLLVASTGFAVLTPNQQENFPFVYLSVCQQNFIKSAVAVASGAAYPAVNQSDFERLEVIVPDKKIMKDFSITVGHNFIAKANLLKMNKLLKEARDILLPRLMTGIIDPEEYHSEKLLEEAVV